MAKLYKLLKLNADNADKLFNKWFAGKPTQPQAEAELEAMQETTTDPLLRRHIQLLQDSLTSDAIFALRTTLQNIRQCNNEWVAVHEVDDALFMFIQYSFDDDDQGDKPTILKVDQMSRFPCGVLKYAQRGGQYQPPVAMLDLFKTSLRQMLQRFPSLSNVEITTASAGSQQLVDKIWPKQSESSKTTKVYQWPPSERLQGCCQICARLPELPLTFEGVGGIFCSRPCAVIQWQQLKKCV
jgi:hypothetical protein